MVKMCRWSLSRPMARVPCPLMNLDRVSVEASPRPTLRPRALTFTVTDGTTPVSSTFEVAVKQDNPLTIWATENRENPFDEAIVNDGRLDTDEGVLDVYISVGGFSFSTPDGSQPSPGGSAWLAPARRGFRDPADRQGPHAGVYPATPTLGRILEFLTLVNGEDGTVDDFDATIKISKPDSGYGSRDLTARPES